MAEIVDLFVPDEFQVPVELTHDRFRLVPLEPEHNSGDYAAWTSSISHIRSTPGFEGYGWPTSMTLEENLRDLRQHAEDFRRRVGFTYSVMVDDAIVGCVYIYPRPEPGSAVVRSWVTGDHAELDGPLYDAVWQWLDKRWPFASVDYAPRKCEPASHGGAA